MKNKKVIIIMLVLGIGIFSLNLVNLKKEKINESKESIKSNDTLTMMLETEAGTGIYEETIASEWPTDGFVFNETLSKCENGGTLTWNDDTKKVVMQSNISDKCYVYFDLEPVILFANYIINEVYTEDGANYLYYHDGTGTYINANQEAGDNSYRYSGANPNNYVCFGSDAATCPNDNLYRIIGLFDDDSDGIYNIKLIKSTSYGNYAWDSGNSNYWNATEKPDVYTTLNTTYWTALNNEWQGLIDETHQYRVGGMTQDNSYTVKQYYDVEIKHQTRYEETMAVGLMYVSDYGYATIPENWQTALYRYSSSTYIQNNWLYLGSYEWTISRRLNYTNLVFIVNSDGDVDYRGVGSSTTIVRPSFYLKSEIALEGGIGSAKDPFRLKI